MRITCLITVCAYLSSTVSTDEIQYLNRLRRIRSPEKSVILDDATARKELNASTGIYPDVFPILRKPRPQRQVETFQKSFPKKNHESQLSSQQQQQQQQQHPRNRSRRPIKRVKVRSIAGSGYEVHDNEVHEIIHEPIPEVHDEEGPIYIKPVVRVTKKNIFDSIIDILSQLLDPPKKELGPIVGPIKMPGSKRKIYLRLLEPADSSHINVRFVTQVAVPVVDEESILSREHASVLPFLPFADPDVTLLHKHINPIASGDVTFSSSNRHQTVQLPRNVSHVSGKVRVSQPKPKPKPKPAIKLKRPSEDVKETDKENVSPVKVEAPSGANKNHVYYQYPSEDDAVKEVTEIIKDATKNEQGAKESLEPWYQLSTHRLPLRQIAPLYPLTAMEHTDSSGSYENTYKVPSYSLTPPGPQSSSYEQYGNVPPNADASGYYDQSSYAIPNTYATTYQEQNEFSNAPSSYPISYQNQNEFNNAPSSTSYVKQNDLFNAPTSHTSSHEKQPTGVPPPSGSYATSHEPQNGAQTGSSSQNALRVIDPPLYFLDPQKGSENHADKVFEHHAIQQQPHNLPNANELGSLVRNTAQNGQLPIDQVTWGKVKREKGESNFQESESNFQRNELNFPRSKSNFHKSVELTPDGNRERWQPLSFVTEDADWHKAFANSAQVGNHDELIARQQLIDPPRQVRVTQNTTPASTIEAGRVDQRQGGKRRNRPAAQNSKCTTSDKGDRCEQTEPTIASTPHPEGTVKIAEGQTQSAANVETIVITPKSVASNTVEILKSNVTTKSSWIEGPQPLVMTTETPATNSTTERLPMLIKVIKNTTEKSIENYKTTSRSMMSKITEKSAASSTTERSSISGTSKAPIPRNSTSKRLPKRPMIMKKPTFVLREVELSQLSSTTRRSVASGTMWKPTMSSTTEKTKTTRRSKFQGAVSKMKSSTT